MPRWEPEAEHRRRHEGGHEQLSAERRGAERPGKLDLAHPGHRLGQPLAVRAPQPPQPREDEREYGGPAQQPIVAIEEQRDEAVAAPGVAGGRARIGRALPGDVRGVRRWPAVERLVEGHIERDGEERQLDRSHRECAALGAPELAHREGANHHARRHELGPEPWQGAQQRKAHERLRANDALTQAQGEQRRARERRAGGQLRIHGAAVGHKRRAEPHGNRRAERPRIGCHPQGEPVGERHRERGDRGQEQLHARRAADGIRGGDQQREAHPVRLVQPALGPASVAVQLVGIEVGVRPLGVLVEHVHVAVLDDRLRGQQVVRLVAAVLRGAERVQPERGRVGGEQQQPEGEGAAHRAPHPSRARLCDYRDLLLVDRHRAPQALAYQHVHDAEVVHDEGRLRVDPLEVLGAAQGIDLLLAPANAARTRRARRRAAGAGIPRSSRCRPSDCIWPYSSIVSLKTSRARSSRPRTTWPQPMNRPASAMRFSLGSGVWREPNPQQPSARAITICWTSSVPSPMVRIFASR